MPAIRYYEVRGRYRVTACVTVCCRAWSIDFNQRGSVAKAGLCSNYRLSVRPSHSRSDPIHARTYTTGSVKRATWQIQSLKCSAHARTHTFDTFETSACHDTREKGTANKRSISLSLSISWRCAVSRASHLKHVRVMRDIHQSVSFEGLRIIGLIGSRILHFYPQ